MLRLRCSDSSKGSDRGDKSHSSGLVSRSQGAALRRDGMLIALSVGLGIGHSTV